MNSRLSNLALTHGILILFVAMISANIFNVIIIRQSLITQPEGDRNFQCGTFPIVGEGSEIWEDLEIEENTEAGCLDPNSSIASY